MKGFRRKIFKSISKRWSNKISRRLNSINWKMIINSKKDRNLLVDNRKNQQREESRQLKIWINMMAIMRKESNRCLYKINIFRRKKSWLRKNKRQYKKLKLELSKDNRCPWDMEVVFLFQLDMLVARKNLLPKIHLRNRFTNLSNSQ